MIKIIILLTLLIIICNPIITANNSQESTIKQGTLEQPMPSPSRPRKSPKQTISSLTCAVYGDQLFLSFPYEVAYAEVIIVNNRSDRVIWCGTVSSDDPWVDLYPLTDDVPVTVTAITDGGVTLVATVSL